MVKVPAAQHEYLRVLATRVKPGIVAYLCNLSAGEGAMETRESVELAGQPFQTVSDLQMC